MTGAISRLQTMARRARASADAARPIDPLGAALLYEAGYCYEQAAMQATRARERWLAYLARGGVMRARKAIVTLPAER